MTAETGVFFPHFAHVLAIAGLVLTQNPKKEDCVRFTLSLGENVLLRVFSDPFMP